MCAERWSRCPRPVATPRCTWSCPRATSARQIPAEWQENVKHRRLVTYGEFLDQIRDPDRTSTLASWFWGVQEVPEILDRWGGDAARPSRCTW